MSYVVQVWEQPAGAPLPRGFDEADELLSRLHRLPEVASAKMSLLAQRLARRFPGQDDDDCVWTDGPMPEVAQGPVWNIGIVTGDRMDDVQVVLVSEAVKLGLNVYDMQAGELHLGDGTVHGSGERAVCVRGMAAALERDYLTARNEFRRLAAQGNRFAHFRWGELFLNGFGVPKDPAAGCALVCAGAGWRCDAQGQAVPPADARQRQIGEHVRRAVGPEWTMRADRLLRKVRPERSIASIIDELMQVRASVEPQVKALSATPKRPAREEAPPPAARPALLPLLLGLVMHGAMFTFPSRPAFFALWLSAAAIGGYGVWRSSAFLGDAMGRRGLLTVGALLPMAGLIACASVLWRCMRPQGSPPR